MREKTNAEFELFQGLQLLLYWSTCPDMEDVTNDYVSMLYFVYPSTWKILISNFFKCFLLDAFVTCSDEWKSFCCYLPWQLMLSWFWNFKDLAHSGQTKSKHPWSPLKIESWKKDSGMRYLPQALQYSAAVTLKT